MEDLFHDLRESFGLLMSMVPSFETLCSTISEKAMASHSSAPDWKIPWTEEPGGLQTMGSLRVRHD